MADDIEILDADDNPKIVKTREKTGSKHVQIFEHDVASPFRSLTASNTGEMVISAKGFLHGFQLMNLGPDTIHFKFYDKASAATSGDTPKKTLSVVAGLPHPYTEAFVAGVEFVNGISIRAVKELADNGTTSPDASSIVANVDYRAAV